MKFRQVILTKIIKTVATGHQIVRLKCSIPCWGILLRSPHSLAGIKGTYFYKGEEYREGKNRRSRREEGREERGWEGSGGDPHV